MFPILRKLWKKIINRINSEKKIIDQIHTIKKSALFDKKWYCKRYRIDKSLCLSPIRHFITNGSKKMFDPGPNFSILAYNSVYPDVRRRKNNALLHYIQNREKEGRLNPAKISDLEYINFLYQKKFSKEINFSVPTNFTEKIQLYKIYYQKLILCELADKYKVRNHVEHSIGKKFVVPLFQICDCFEDVNFEKLPDKFVMKTNHGSGCMMICHDKNQFDWKLAQKKFQDWMKINFYWIHREFSYKFIKPKILVEEYLHNENFYVPRDYKISCFNGNPLFFEIYSDRFKNLGSAYYDLDWNRLPFRKSYQSTNVQIEKPRQFDEMLSIAKTLSKDFPFVRVDLYLLNERLYFGEMTFYPGGGMTKFTPDDWDSKVGSWFDISSFYPTL